jgi:hypothetical protein
MKRIKLFEEFQFSFNKEDKIKSIKNLHGLPKELKEVAYNFVKFVTSAKKGKVFGLDLHPELKSKIKEGGYPDGFDMGIDKDGYFIHTHRARSKSHEKPSGITAKEMKFIDSTG